MTFTYDDADLSTIIQNFNCWENLYHVDYMDGSFSEYYCADPDEKNRLEKIMLDQAIERNQRMNYDDKVLLMLCDTLLGAFNVGLAANAVNDKNYLFLAIPTLAAAFCLKDVVVKIKLLIELRKYQIFFDIMEDLKKVSPQNMSSLIKNIEKDPFYRDPLDISHLDCWSLFDVMLIRKYLPKYIN